MQYFLTSAALVASASLSFAAPHLVPRSAFEVKQVAGNKFYKSGPVQMLNTYKKFARVGAKAPSHVLAAAAAAQTGEVTASPQQYDQAYLCPVTIGSSKLTLDFDTGSADLWVFSSDTPSSSSAGHGLYDPSTGTKLDDTWEITYGDQSGASGIVYADTVVVGGVTATKQAVEAATSVSSTFAQNTANDGLLGLAFSSINQVKPDPQTTFFDTVKSTLAKGLFTADLKKGGPGTYTFGYIDTSKYTGPITYVPVDNSQGFWQFTAGGYAVGGNNATTGSVGTAIADTGTSLLYLPSNVAQAYYAQVTGATLDQQQGGYTLPCNADAPDFIVAIGGKTFTVPGNYISYAPISGSSSTCFGGIQPDTGIGFSIFGDIFLKAVYAIFDDSGSSPRLGFAASK